jgi:small-conductance mechanosensitive channel
MKVVSTGMRITRYSITTFLVLFGALTLILTLPTADDTIKFEILKFLGILLSAGIALSSTTLLGNMIAGIMNNSMKRFRNGDLIKIGDYQGRVTQKGIFHIELQLEDSNFMAIPNLYIATNPLKLTRKTNTVISASVSLGYDVPRAKVEAALKEAAIATGLTDPYVYITGLGDFSVVYKIHGFLQDSGKFFSISSLLNGKVMDALHDKNIEIVSPTFMNQRRVDEVMYVPKKTIKPEEKKDDPAPEELIFDEANKSESIEKKKDLLKKIEENRKKIQDRLKELKDDQEIEQTKSKLERLNEIREKIQKNIEEQSEK